MKVKEQFALAVRVIGILGIIYVLRTFIRNPLPEVTILVIRVVCAFVGVYFIRGAPLLVKFAYPESGAEPLDKTTA